MYFLSLRGDYTTSMFIESSHSSYGAKIFKHEGPYFYMTFQAVFHYIKYDLKYLSGILIANK